MVMAMMMVMMVFLVVSIYCLTLAGAAVWEVEVQFLWCHFTHHGTTSTKIITNLRFQFLKSEPDFDFAFCFLEKWKIFSHLQLPLALLQDTATITMTSKILAKTISAAIRDTNQKVPNFKTKITPKNALKGGQKMLDNKHALQLTAFWFWFQGFSYSSLDGDDDDNA